MYGVFSEWLSQTGMEPGPCLHFWAQMDPRSLCHCQRRVLYVSCSIDFPRTLFNSFAV